ncbi:MAG: hypothetical protein IPM29_08255 [Planctomycetes bacterium]|nr:hypothetical protein [Planctomycetota bacterium]
MYRASTSSFALRLALVTCLLAAAVPGSGLVLCFNAGGIDFSVGDDDRCPAGLPNGGDQPLCQDVHVDGNRDGPPPATLVPELAFVGFLVITWAEPEWVPPALAAPASRDPPDRCDGDRNPSERPWLARLSGARRAMLLLI